MSTPDTSSFWERLPPWLAPRTEEQPGRGCMRRAEAVVLVLVGLLLATATIYDLTRQIGINDRLARDLQTWRTYTHENLHNISIDQELLGTQTKREVLCGNVNGGAPGTKPQICLMIEGPVRHGEREVSGGWYLPAYTPDIYGKRERCFGRGRARSLCPR